MGNPRLSAHRQIGFTGGKEVKEIAEEKPEVGKRTPAKPVPQKKPSAAPSQPKVVADNESSAIYEWLESHPLININGLCREAGIDRANFVKAKDAGKDLNNAILAKFKSILSKYGFE